MRAVTWLDRSLRRYPAAAYVALMTGMVAASVLMVQDVQHLRETQRRVVATQRQVVAQQAEGCRRDELVADIVGAVGAILADSARLAPPERADFYASALGRIDALNTSAAPHC